AKRLKHFLLIFFFSSCIIYSQEKDIIANYKSYTEAPREVVYLHLNKSTYVKGEDIGFTAYVFNKQSKKPSLITTNLYVSLEDENNNIVEQALLKVEDGVASNVITIDSTYALGNYTIKAYTNWIRNFNGQGAFIEPIKIVEPNIKNDTNVTPANEKIDAQFLPEGGHLLHNVVNSVGVVLKDSNGLGIANATGKVMDKNNQLITEFKVNHLGIGRFLLMAESNNSYTIEINHDDKEHHMGLNQKVEPLGVTLSVVSHRNKAIVTLITNNESLAQIKDKPYALALHNGKEIDIIDVVFKDETTIIKMFDLNTLPAGINMFTLFNENKQPIVERLLFNYNGIQTIKPQKVVARQVQDSIEIELNINQIDPSLFNNISVSVLPQKTASYGHQHNIISHTYLKPYVKGPIEQAKYYFTDINEEKKMELDNLLITQGWSSYDWNNIFNNPNTYPHPFERGITVKANFPSKDLSKDGKPNYLMYYINDDSNFMVSESELGQTSHLLESLFPKEDNTLNISKVSNDNKLDVPSYYLQFFPRVIPKLNTNDIGMQVVDVITEEKIDNFLGGNLIVKSSKNIQLLDEVVLKGKIDRKLERQNALRARSFGRVFVVDEQMDNSHTFLSTFLESRGMIVDEEKGTFTASFPTGVNGPANMFFDDALLIDTGILVRYFLFNIDYIEINRWGLGDGMRSPNGFVKIYSKDLSHPRFQKETSKEYKFPLTFSKKKKFYAPKYRYYGDDFYKQYGTIDWKPNLSLDVSGKIKFNIPEQDVPISLFIEGIANDGAFVFEEKSISLN
ncbi:hypothetical protein, partial [Winogradskyella sp.]|uniref:hypothetical protein n=1 Tax=Winogradskyella sp. TaxID=1883156 RepID=UPI00260F210D